MPLTKDQIAERAKKTSTIEVSIDSLNDTVLMRTPSIAEWRRINANHVKTLNRRSSTTNGGDGRSGWCVSLQ